MVQKDVTTPYLLVSYHVPQTKDSDYYALDVLSSVLSRGNSSRLYSSLVDKKQLATEVFTDLPYSFDPFSFYVYVECNTGVKEADVETALFKEIDSIKQNGITDRELQKVKNQKLMEFYQRVESINGKSESIGTYEVFFGDYKKMFNAPADYNKVTIDDVKRVANQYFKKSNRTVGVLQTNVED